MTGYEGNLTEQEQLIVQEVNETYQRVGDPEYDNNPTFDGRQWCNNLFLGIEFRSKSASWLDFPGRFLIQQLIIYFEIV